MFDKEKAKEEVKKLIEKYNRLVESGKLKSYNEEMTKKDFILPLFRALGWSVEDGEEVTAEEKISRGRVDYGFRIESIPKLFLEAKALKENLAKVEFAEQAINYAWHKGATWAILTDFEGVKVFNAEWKSANPLQNMFFSLTCNQFLERFDQLLLLSRESLEKGLIDKEAEKWGKKAKKIPIDKQLLNDLTKFRELLNKNILKNNYKKDLTGDELDETVQRILDRLIFIRTLEDKQLEAPVLQALIREDKHKKVYKKLNILFRKIDDIYNSKLFRPHLCEELIIDDEILEKIIRGLFKTTDNTIHYDFGAIDADVLGNMYEQYLGHLLKKTAKRAKLTSGKTHRKEQGIYYTPTYVVDYIVKNTVGEFAKSKKFDLKNIKILDPACGSGSFLMKAFDYLITLDKQKNKDIDQTKLDLTGASATYGRKVEILKNNIFGVDLDPKAVEIAQLNLLLKAAEKKHRLPTLQENIKVGNSLIDDSIVSNRAFKWEDEFKEIISEGGFDVVIGNPPYIMVENLPKNEREYMMLNFQTALKRFDIYIGFIEKAIHLLKKGGIVGFIIPYQFLTQDYAEKLREYILKECTIRQIVDLSQIKIFEEATVRNIILILEKGKYKIKTKIVHSTKPNIYDSFDIYQEIFNKIPEKRFRTNVNEKNFKILEKINSKSFDLGKIAIASWGARGVPKKEFQLDKPINKLCNKMIKGINVSRYSIKYTGKWFLYDVKKLYRPAFPELFENEKLVFRGIVDKRGMVIAYDTQQYYTDHSLNCLILKFNLKDKNLNFLRKRKININSEEIELSKQFNLKFLLGIINSELINFYFKLCFSDELHVYPEMIEKIPIPKLESLEQQKPIIKLVDKMLTLHEKLNKIDDKKTDESAKIEEEIKKTDKEIDEIVYKLYGITEKEKKIIEESLK